MKIWCLIVNTFIKDTCVLKKKNGIARYVNWKKVLIIEKGKSTCGDLSGAAARTGMESK